MFASDGGLPTAKCTTCDGPISKPSFTTPVWIHDNRGDNMNPDWHAAEPLEDSITTPDAKPTIFAADGEDPGTVDHAPPQGRRQNTLGDF